MQNSRLRALTSLAYRSLTKCTTSTLPTSTTSNGAIGLMGLESGTASGCRGFKTSAYSRSDKSLPDPSKIRDFAIIAHIDHGKTTLMDRLLAMCGRGSSEDRVMDSNTLEKERGITILSKYTSFNYKGYTINAVDTPGHADFGGEALYMHWVLIMVDSIVLLAGASGASLEAVLGMVDGAVLLVDATEGALAQTKFVLEKALRRGFKPIVLMNKVDRESSTPERTAQVENQLFDLFASLGANDEQLDFLDGRILYASAKQGWATTELPEGGKAPPGASMAPLLDAIVRVVPPPVAPLDEPFTMCVAMIEKDNFIGRIATGRVASGVARVGDNVKVLSRSSDGTVVSVESKITRIFKRSGVEKVQLDQAIAGDVVSIAGAAAGITDTIAATSVTEPLDPGHIDPPTLSIMCPLCPAAGGRIQMTLHRGRTFRAKPAGRMIGRGYGGG
eukprot:gene17223-23545_t